MSKDLIQNIDRLYARVKGIIETSRGKIYRSTNLEMLNAYWEIGREIIVEEQNGTDRAEYGKYIIRNLTDRLTIEYGQGFVEQNLRNMRQFYRVFPIRNALRSELTWTHYRTLMRVEDEEARKFYMEEAIMGNWSTRELERQKNSLYYERLLMSKDRKKMIKDGRNTEGKMQAEQIIKDPFVLEFINIKQSSKLSEKILETALIDKLKHFLLELGSGFAFVGRQYRITTETGIHFYIDLVFYNYILKCFLLIDLKTSKLMHQDIGQMDMYVRIFEDLRKQEGDNPTIGLILCTEKDKTVVKYSVLNEGKQVFASKYQMYFPTEKQLAQELQREIEQIEQEKRLLNE